MTEHAAYGEDFRMVQEAPETLDALLPRYVLDFPAVERKPELLLRELLSRGHYRLLAVRSRETGACAAYLMGYPVGGTRHFFLDFFAVEPGFRGCGLGAWTLRTLGATLGVDGLFFELEIPAEDAARDDPRVRRLDFYKRLGAFSLPVDYALLLEDGTLFPMLFCCLPFVAETPDLRAVREAVSTAYEYTYGIMPEAYPGWRATLARILESLG